MQVNKSLLKKCLAAICCICLTLACVFGVAACGGDTTVKNVTASGSKITVELTDGTKQEYTLDGVVSAEEKDGVIKVIYADGTTDEISTGKVSEIKTSIKEDGKTYITLKFADGTEKEVALEKVVAKVEKQGENAIKVTYTDGSTETLDYSSAEECDHEFGNAAVVKPASCQEEGLSIRVCKNCGYVESVIIAKDTNVHGTWVFDATVTPGTLIRHENANGIITFERADEGTTHYVLRTNYVYGSMTTLEDHSGMAETCFTAKCADCNEVFEEGHAPVEEWINVPFNDNTVNVCENEHTVVKTCPDCKSVFLYDDGSYAYNGKTGDAANELVTETEPALGHTYVLSDAAPERLANGNYKMTLTCSRCSNVINPEAVKVGEVFATCKQGGYKTFRYSYENFVNGERTPITEEIQLEKTERTTDHTVGKKADGSLLQFAALNLSTGTPKYEFTPEVKPFVENGTIAWNEGKPANCSTYMAAVFTCTVCNEKIVISLSGEHTYGEEHVVAKTCTTNGYSYKDCTACGDRYEYNTVAATGHVYTYVNGSFNAEAGTAQFRCTACGDVQTKNVVMTADVPAADCRSKSYKDYKATLDNGIGGTQEITFRIESATEVLYHTIKAGMRKYAAYNVATGEPKYDHNADFAAAIADGTVEWSEGKPASCNTHMAAVFVCTVCHEKIVIALSGEHMNLDESDKHEVAATCTARGYVEVKCTDCGEYIEQSATDAKGHRYAPETESWNAFLANETRDGATVVFKCADCEDTITLTAKETVLAPTRNGCTTTNTKQYDFYANAATKTNYTYTVETAEQTEKTLTFTYTWSDVKTTGAHLIGKYNGADVTAVAFNMAAPTANEYEWVPSIASFFADETLRWNEGKPGTCSEHALAVFTCKTCGEQVVISVSGEHVFTTTKTVAASVAKENVGSAVAATPTCTEGTKTWMYCTACNEWHEDTAEAKPALGHDIPTSGWEVVGPFNAEANYNAVTGKVELVTSTLQVGKAVGTCTRCGYTQTVDTEKIGNRKTGWKIAKSEMPNCAKTGYIVVEYYYEINGVSTKVAEHTIEIAKFDEHITTFVGATHYVKAYDKATGDFIITYYCDGCGQFVVYARGTEATINNIIKTELGIENVNNSRA